MASNYKENYLDTTSSKYQWKSQLLYPPIKSDTNFEQSEVATILLFNNNFFVICFFVYVVDNIIIMMLPF